MIGTLVFVRFSSTQSNIIKQTDMLKKLCATGVLFSFYYYFSTLLFSVRLITRSRLVERETAQKKKERIKHTFLLSFPHTPPTEKHHQLNHLTATSVQKYTHATQHLNNTGD